MEVDAGKLGVEVVVQVLEECMDYVAINGVRRVEKIQIYSKSKN